ncbi:MAG: S46 family peptidase [Methanocorpusculum parvum]|nr:S46 family peptidase [Methanocorpusculum parvum]
MDALTLCIILVAVCFAVIIITGFLEILLKKNKEAKAVPAVPEPETEPQPDFTIGRIYQMEDGSFAKYAGDGKFLKVKK